jgi:hypothetical protein
MRKTWLLFFAPLLAFAGAGANGGSGSSQLTPIDYDLVYGTFSLGGSSFNYLTTDAPPSLILDSGDDPLQAMQLLTGLDPRFYSGISELLLSPTSTDNIAFSTGAFGEIGSVTDASEILNEAIALGLIESGGETSSASIGTFQFGTVTSTVDGPPVESFTQPYDVKVTEIDFSGTVAPSAVPEPSAWPVLLMLSGALIGLKCRRQNVT